MSDIHQFLCTLPVTVLMWRHSDTLRISGFATAILRLLFTFTLLYACRRNQYDRDAHVPYGGMSMLLKRVTSLRRAQANAPSLSYWLRLQA